MNVYRHAKQVLRLKKLVRFLRVAAPLGEDLSEHRDPGSKINEKQPKLSWNQCMYIHDEKETAESHLTMNENSLRNSTQSSDLPGNYHIRIHQIETHLITSWGSSNLFFGLPATEENEYVIKVWQLSVNLMSNNKIVWCVCNEFTVWVLNWKEL